MNNQGKILIIDDDKTILKSLKILLDNEFAFVSTISNPNLILSEYKKEKYDIVLLDMNFNAGLNSGNEGIFWLNKLLEEDEDAVVIMITAYGDINTAVKSMKEGATDFIIKPWNNEKLIATLKSALKIRRSQLKIKKLDQQKEYLNNEINKSGQEMIGSSSKMNLVYDLIDKVAGTDASVLILGENGTGKELVAREIHKKSKRANNPMISIDMGSIAETLFESELFGYKKGAFTDAKSDKTGRIELADSGTLFLDEITNIPVGLQSKLLSVLQNKSITPLGGTKPVYVNLRLISATNKAPDQLIKNGLFREDLLYRINTVTIELPPLRERENDIINLADYYLNIYKNKYNKPKLILTKEAINTLMQYSWPGNVRELKHNIEKAVILCAGNSLTSEDFMLNKEQRKSDWPLTFEEIEKTAIKRALKNNGGKIVDAAKELGLTRQTLHNKINKYKI